MARLAPVMAGLLLAACGVHGFQTGTKSPASQPPIELRDAPCFSAPQPLALAGGAGAWVTGVQADLAEGLPAFLAPELANVEQSDDASHYDWRFVTTGGVPVCSLLARAHRVRGITFVDGRFDAGLNHAAAPEELVWEEAERVFAAAAATLGQGAASLSLGTAARCVDLTGDRASAAWELDGRIGGHPYHVVGSSAHLAKIQDRAHPNSGIGKAQAFTTGPVDGKLETVDLVDLDGSDQLRSTRFTTYNDGDGPAALSGTHDWTFPPSDPRFVEASLFVHAEAMAAWFQQPDHHYSFNCLPLGLHAHATFYNWGQATVNNAMYTGPEADPNGQPTIQVGDGDGLDLVNLGVDFDVVAHELGHHVIYRKLKAREGESGVIHEGLADYFVFARTGNDCLGESICPAGSGFCEIAGRCLRSAANTYKITDPDLSQEVHKRSQFLSGMLWDLGRQPGLTQDTVAALVIKAVDYLQAESGYTDLVKGMLAADLELFRGTHACLIVDGANARGLQAWTNGLDCKSYEKPAPG